MDDEYAFKHFNIDDVKKIGDFVFDNNISKSSNLITFIDHLKEIKRLMRDSPTGNIVIRNFSSYSKPRINESYAIKPTIELATSIDFNNVLFVAKNRYMPIKTFNKDSSDGDVHIGSYNFCAKYILKYFNVYGSDSSNIKNIFPTEEYLENVAVIEKIFNEFAMLSFPSDKSNTQKSTRTALVTPLGIIEQYFNMLENPLKNKNLEDILTMYSVNFSKNEMDSTINNGLAERILRGFDM